MNRNYSLDDVEALRARSGISYEEAVSLLDKYDGDMARALIELEKRGVITGKKKAKNNNGESFTEWLKRMWVTGMRTRIHITKDDQTLVNLSVIYMIIFVICAPWLAIPSLLLVLILGCRMSLLRNSNLYGDAEIQTILSDAAENIKSGVQSFTSVDSKDEGSETAQPKSAEAPVQEAPTPAQDYVSPFRKPEPVKEEPTEESEPDDFDSITIE